jgi:hypothetical protein
MSLYNYVGPIDGVANHWSSAVTASSKWSSGWMVVGPDKEQVVILFLQKQANEVPMAVGYKVKLFCFPM